MANIYQALDNNGSLISLIISKRVAVSLADDHYKDVAEFPLLGDEHPGNTPVQNGMGAYVGILARMTA